MSDQSPFDGAGKPPQDDATDRGPAPLIQIQAQYIKDLSFENPNAPQSLRVGVPQPQVSIGVDIRTNTLGEGLYEVVLNLRADAKHGDHQAFLVELAYGGVVAIGNLPKEHLAPVLLVEVPHLLFPFARAVIAQATREGGFPPLMVQPIDFAEMFRRQVMTVRDRQEQSGQVPLN